MYDDKLNRVRCDTCGKFMQYMQKGSSWAFVPSSDISYEENIEQCAKCTKKYGRPIPFQNVRLDRCCGVY